jgi:hypothetical protein
MTCQDCRDALIDGGASKSVVEEAHTHLSACAGCRQAVESLRALRGGLRAVAETTRDASASELLEARLLEQFRALHAPAAVATNAARWRWVAAAAVVLVAGASLLLSPRRRDEIGGGQQALTSIREAPPPTAGAAPTPPQTTRVAAETTPAVRRTRQPHVVHPEGFVPLPIAAGLPQFESGEIVRIEIPLMALPAYGVDVPPDAADKPVQADLLVGQDGQPRAIRLVTTETHDRRSKR